MGTSDLAVIRTSNPHWVRDLALAYKQRLSITLIDDASLGVDPAKQSIVQMGLKASLGIQGWVAVFTALGVAGIGVYLLYAAIIDPEPFSKIGIALGAGVILTMGGGYAAIRVLTGIKPPNVAVTPERGFSISWE